jgi:two-component system sensor histidine kinase/response regulator
MMSGQIWCVSIPGQGSSFIFTARFGATEAWRHKDQAPKLYVGRRALAVDDNPSALQILGSNLSNLGFQVIRASSGESALNRVKASQIKGDLEIPDVILVDYKMIKLNGLETIERLWREYAPQKPMAILLVSGLASEEIQNQAKALGVSTILSKPLSLTSLQAGLSGLLDRAAAQKPAGTPKVDPLAILAHLKGRPILLVEDNEVNQLVASKILRKAGFEVKIANNGLEALDMIQRHPFDLVLMDIQMPEMDGLTATREIRKMKGFEDLPIVAMTAHAMSGDRDLSLAAGMNDHVTKPIDMPELFKALARWMPKSKEDLESAEPGQPARDQAPSAQA